jgi:hypothetical protein
MAQWKKKKRREEKEHFDALLLGHLRLFLNSFEVTQSVFYFFFNFYFFIIHMVSFTLNYYQVKNLNRKSEDTVVLHCEASAL